MRLIAITLAAVLSTLTLGLGSTVAHATPNTENKPSSHTVTVNPGDNLSFIADAHQSTVQRLYDANLNIEHPDLIYPGDQVRVPADDEQLAHRPMPANAVVAQPEPAAPAPAAESPATEPAAAPAPEAPVTAPTVASGSVWDQLAHCEATGDWAANTGNGFYGGLQFTLSSWQAVGGSGLPSDASREEQIMRAEQLQAMQGWGAWPACTAKLGLQ